MAKTKKHTRSFKERQCAYCKLADKRELRKGRPNYCGYKNDTGKDPDISNGHCLQREPTPKSSKNEASQSPKRSQVLIALAKND